jgi:hypothetical protein
MPVDKKFEMKLLKATKILKTERRPVRVAKIEVKPSTRQIFQAFKKARGYDKIIARIPKAATPEGWDQGTQVAYFSVCGKSGSARYLDLWDCDHFDGFTDMRQSIDDCRAWFSHTGYATWGSAQTATGRINCYFNAAVAGDYSCVVQLASYPAASSTTAALGPCPFRELSSSLISALFRQEGIIFASARSMVPSSLSV